MDSLTISSVSYVPAHRCLVFAGRNGQLVQRGLTGNTLQQLPLPGPIDSVAITPDGRHVAVGNTNGTI